MTILDQVNATPTPHKRLPWNKGKLTGARPPLRPKHVWSIRTKLQIEGRARDLAMFKLAIDSKLRGCDLAHERPLSPEAALGGLEIQLPPYPRNRTQLGNRGMSEMCQYRPKGLARSTYWREKIDSGGNAHSGSHARRSASIFREAGAR
jgi:hypothetical protein